MAVTAVAAVVLAACSSAHPDRHVPTQSSGRPSPTVSSSPVTSTSPGSDSPTSSPPTTHAVTTSADEGPPPPRQQLPEGGTRILGHYRVVADYGAAGGGALGVLGRGTPEQAAEAVLRRARGFRGFGLPVQPAMELIATVAQASPGPGGDYSQPVPHSVIERYLAAAHRHHMLLILDLQPGRSTFLKQVKGLGSLLLDPSVGVALDSEWKVGPHQRPGGGLIGSSRAGDINAVAHYLSHVVRSNHLPDKLMIVHEFTSSMLPNRKDIRTAPGVEVVFHADGFGTPAQKKGVYTRLHFPGRPFGTGFKLFLTQDSRLMTPAQVMRLHHRPDVITYQ